MSVKANGQWMDSMWTGGLLCVSATACMWMIWFDHLWQVDRRKGQAVAVGAFVVWALRNEQHHRRGGH